MQRYLEELCPADPVQINERIRTLQVYMARSGEMLAQAKELLNRNGARRLPKRLSRSPERDTSRPKRKMYWSIAGLPRRAS